MIDSIKLTSMSLHNIKAFGEGRKDAPLLLRGALFVIMMDPPVAIMDPVPSVLSDGAWYILCCMEMNETMLYKHVEGFSAV